MDTEPKSELALHEDKLQADDEPPVCQPKNGFNAQLVKPNGQPLNGSGSGAITPSTQSIEFLHRHFPSANLNDWNDWRWQVRNSIKSVSALKQFLESNQR
jgi:hypothetical protein